MIEDVVAELLTKKGMRRLVAETNFDLPTGLGGARLPTIFHERVAFSRAGIKRPDVLVLDRALASHNAQQRQRTREELRKLLPEATLVFLEENFENPDAYDLYVEIEDGRIDGMQRHDDTEEGDDLSRKLRAITRTEMFSGLESRNQRLLAFAAQWYKAEAGQRIFSVDEKADAAYLCVSGTALLSYQGSDGETQPVSNVEPGRLIGDLAIILNEPRQLNLTATSEVIFLRLGAKEFCAVLENDASVLMNMLQTVAGHLTGVVNFVRHSNMPVSQDGIPMDEARLTSESES